MARPVAPLSASRTRTGELVIWRLAVGRGRVKANCLHVGLSKDFGTHQLYVDFPSTRSEHEMLRAVGNDEKLAFVGSMFSSHSDWGILVPQTEQTKFPVKYPFAVSSNRK